MSESRVFPMCGPSMLLVFSTNVQSMTHKHFYILSAFGINHLSPWQHFNLVLHCYARVLSIAVSNELYRLNTDNEKLSKEKQDLKAASDRVAQKAATLVSHYISSVHPLTMLGILDEVQCALVRVSLEAGCQL